MYCWGKPMSSRTFHIFRDSRSLCGKWLFNADEKVTEQKPIEAKSGDCKACVRAFNAIFAKSKSITE